MWSKIQAVIRHWYILGIAVAAILIFPPLYSALHQIAPPPGAAPSPPAVAQNQQATPSPAPPTENQGPSTQSQNKPAEPRKTAETTAQNVRPAPAPKAAAESKAPAEPNARPPQQAQTVAQQAAGPAPPTAPDSSQEHNAATPSAPSGGEVKATPPASQPVSGGDASAGRLVFRKCQACHSLEPGKNLVGPSLAGVMGRKAGSEPGYSYSPAMKQADIVWNVKTLDGYLNDPQKALPGNKMPFPGLKTDHDRADVIAYLAASAGGAASAATAQQNAPVPSAQPSAAPATQPPQNAAGTTAEYIPDARYTLRSGIAEGRMVYLGVGGAIDGKVNPVLTAAVGQVVQLTLINGEGAEHDIVFPDQDSRSPRVTGKGASTTTAFRAARSGDFIYFCSVPGHRQAGMEGQFIVTPKPPAQTVVEADISREPSDLPPPLAKREPQTVRVDLLTAEVEGRLAEGTTFGYWTFNGKVPGPFIRVRVGDTVDIHVKNAADSSMIHSVDFHAATGPGGGAAALQVDPGKEKSMTWKALVPGLYVYHCATPMVAEHIANGMYGMILVEPEAGLPAVDHEFYVMQGEIYTDQAFGQRGSQEFSVEKLLNEHPEYFVFNGSVGALTRLHPLHAKVGEKVRIFFGVGGPNFTSSFHVIGEIFDNVYSLGGVEAAPLHGIQTVTVPPGGAVITEFKLDVPGNYTLVDHALARAERGLVGILSVEGPPNPGIYNGEVMPGMGH
jgi:nitrite reductase (NO-forming)